jgi:hypothetical protein
LVGIRFSNRRCLGLAKKFKLKTDKYIEKVVKTYGTVSRGKKEYLWKKCGRFEKRLNCCKS